LVERRHCSTRIGRIYNLISSRLESISIRVAKGDHGGAKMKMDELIIVGAAPAAPPLKIGNSVRCRVGKAHEALKHDPRAVGVVSWIEPYPTRVGVSNVRVKFDEYETCLCMQSDFELT
jgi:hypothetical protein